MLLEKDKFGRVKEHMQDYQVIAMIVLLGCVIGFALLILDLGFLSWFFLGHDFLF